MTSLAAPPSHSPHCRPVRAIACSPNHAILSRSLPDPRYAALASSSTHALPLLSHARTCCPCSLKYTHTLKVHTLSSTRRPRHCSLKHTHTHTHTQHGLLVTELVTELFTPRSLHCTHSLSIPPSLSLSQCSLNRQAHIDCSWSIRLALPSLSSLSLSFVVVTEFLRAIFNM